MSFSVTGYGNLTNAFGRSVAQIVVAGATVWPLRAGNRAQWLGLTILSTLALLSHVSTFAILLATLIAVAALLRLSRDPDWKQLSTMILTAAITAAAFSVVVYYGHFGNVYMTVLRARTADAASIASRTVEPALYLRTADALTMTAAAIGWPILTLAAVGAWRVKKEAVKRPPGGRDRCVVPRVHRIRRAGDSVAGRLGEPTVFE